MISAARWRDSRDCGISTIERPAMSFKFFTSIGAAAGATFVAFLGWILGIDSQTSLDTAIVGYVLIPAMVGAVIGAMIGCAVVLALRPNVALYLSMIAWMFLLGFAAVFVPALVMLVYNWATGIGTCGFPLRGTGPSVDPFSFQALANSLNHVLIFVVFLSLPIGVGGAVIGAIVAMVKWKIYKSGDQPPVA
jgi:hypothetical protein